MKQCVHQLVEDQAKRTPQHIAVVFENQTLTYQELNQRANQLAHYLQAQGVQPETLVGFCLERSPAMMVTLLAILKAGGAYLPLDPSYPPTRLAYIWSDAQASLLLTTRTGNAAGFLNLEGLGNLLVAPQIIYLDEHREVIAQESVLDPLCPAQLHHPIYCLYTSGSTGLPKGVVMEHASLTNLVGWHLQNRLTGARMVQYAPISFDVSCHEIFATWCSGGTLYLLTEETRKDAFALLNFINQNQIAKLYLPFTALQQLASAVQQTRLETEFLQETRFLTSVREIMITGEPLQITATIAQLFSQIDCRLYNHYGATEFQDATTFTLTGHPAEWPPLSPVGKPIDNVQIYLLDDAKKPVPTGAVGELYIGGVGVARGYLNRPELTAEKFIPNPMGEGRLYKTGDRARYRPDGNLEVLGRLDYQVKVRGYRIELGEIEAVLHKHPAIKQAVVLVQEDTTAKDNYLVAYILTDSPQHSPQPGVHSVALSANLVTELRRVLKNQLPEHMLPAAYMILDAFPLTPTGKVDRQALPRPTGKQRELSQPLVGPRDLLETQLVTLWQTVLNMAPIGIHDDFFELGGHSLTAMQLLIQIQQLFQLELSLHILLQQRTIANLVENGKWKMENGEWRMENGETLT